MQSYQVTFTVFSEDIFPDVQFFTINRYEVETENARPTKVIIKGIKALDDGSALLQAESEFAAFAGLMLLNLGMLIQTNGQASVLQIDKNGNINPSHNRSNMIMVRAHVLPIDTDMEKYTKWRKPTIQKALAFYHLAIALRASSTASYLNMFLAFDVLVHGSGLTPQQKDYEHLRDALAHVAPYRDPTANFLKEKFQTNDPDWNNSHTTGTVREWCNKLQAEVELILKQKML